MNNKNKIKQRIKKALELAKQTIFLEPILKDLMNDLEILLQENVDE